MLSLRVLYLRLKYALIVLFKGVSALHDEVMRDIARDEADINLKQFEALAVASDSLASMLHVIYGMSRKEANAKAVSMLSNMLNKPQREGGRHESGVI